MNDERVPPVKRPAAAGDRQERLARALKDNLRKRKAQQRARAAAAPPVKPRP
jgi:hypothetical protein